MARFTLRKDQYQFDVFLSHATEDKSEVARPLAQFLRVRGLRVWYDEFELRIGDSLTARIDAGVKSSRFGIIVLSHSFIAKRWTNHELDMLEHLWVNEQRVLFPVWHRITIDEIRAYRVWLANIVGLDTDFYTIQEIADEIHESIIAYFARQLETGNDNL